MLLPLLLLCASGCGGFAARRIAQAPNTYPQWFAPKAPVTLEFSEKMLTAFTNQYLQVDSPVARIRYRIIPPADYQFRWTNRLDEGHGQLDLHFTADGARLPNGKNYAPRAERGTVLLLHGYGVSGFEMLPWAFLLAKEGWRCVLVDLRGHGKSTGKRIYFGVQEVRDLSTLLDKLEQTSDLTKPIAVVGHSYGAALALRWRITDPRVGRVVAISPYADLSSAVLRMRQQYASWFPKSFIEAGLRKLPELLGVNPSDLNPSRWIQKKPETSLFIAGGADKIAPVEDIDRLYKLSGPGNQLLIIPNAAHEPLPFYLDVLEAPIIQWLDQERVPQNLPARSTTQFSPNSHL